MARFDTTVIATADPQVIFDFLADFSTVAQWDPGVSAARLVDGVAGATGARYLVTAEFLGRRIPLEYHCLLAERPTDSGGSGRIELRAENADFVSFDVITIRPVGAGTEVRYDADLALRGIRRIGDLGLRVVFEVIGRRASRGLGKALSQLGSST
jgi:carbon monoxide dehydrogenase subunit G